MDPQATWQRMLDAYSARDRIEAIEAADVVVTNINDALDLVIYPQRLKATLRS